MVKLTRNRVLRNKMGGLRDPKGWGWGKKIFSIMWAGRGWGKTKPCRAGVKPHPLDPPRPIVIPNLSHQNHKQKQTQDQITNP